MLQAVVMWFHVIAAMFWIGGMLFFALVVVPCLKGALNPSEKTSLISRIGKRFRICGWISLGILLFTGPLRLYQKGIPLHSYGKPLQVKLFLVFVMVLLTLVHDFVLGPKSIAMSQAGVVSNVFQIGVRWMARLNLLIGLSIVLSAVFLVHGF